MGIIEAIREIYKPFYIAINLILFVAFYFLFNYLIGLQQYGLPSIIVPSYLIYALVATSSILITIAAYSIRNAVRQSSKVSTGALGTATAIIGAIVGGCGCAAPFLFGLTTFGISSVFVVGLDNFLSASAVPIFALMIAINLFAIVYNTKKLSRLSCRSGRQKQRRSS